MGTNDLSEAWQAGRRFRAEVRSLSGLFAASQLRSRGAVNIHPSLVLTDDKGPSSQSMVQSFRWCRRLPLAIVAGRGGTVERREASEAIPLSGS